MSQTAGEPPPSSATPRGEHRWPPSLAIVALIAIPFLLPSHLLPRVFWLSAPLELGLLVAIICIDPGRIDRRSEVIRSLSIVLTGLFALMAIVATGWLVAELIDGAPNLDNAEALLATGAIVLLDVNLTFSLLYWQLDGGGSAERLHRARRYPDFAFPEHQNPELAPPSWRPVDADYLYLGFTNATAFSPTDVMPLARAGRSCS